MVRGDSYLTKVNGFWRKQRIGAFVIELTTILLNSNHDNEILHNEQWRVKEKEVQSRWVKEILLFNACIYSFGLVFICQAVPSLLAWRGITKNDSTLIITYPHLVATCQWHMIGWWVVPIAGTNVLVDITFIREGNGYLPFYFFEGKWYDQDGEKQGSNDHLYLLKGVWRAVAGLGVGWVKGKQQGWSKRQISVWLLRCGDVESNPGPGKLRVLQININGWKRHRKELQRLLAREKPHLVLVQETLVVSRNYNVKMPDYQ